MRRIFAVFILISMMAILFADTTTETTSFEMSAYLDAELPDLDYTITVSNYETSSITGFTNEYDISDTLTSSSLSIASALVITIESNLVSEIPVEITFSPFVNQKDSTDLVSIKYTYTTGSFSTVQGSNKVNSGNSSYSYRYTPGLTLVDSSDTTISSGSTFTTGTSGETVTLTHYIATIQYKKSGGGGKGGQGGSGSTSWTTTTMPSGYTTLPGFADGQVLTTTAYFALSLESDAYDNLAANIDYAATIVLTITSV